MNRRDFLGTTSGSIIVAVGGTGSGCTLTGSANPALAPWQHAGSSYTEPRQRALSYAILAPNPHNRQPWVVDLSIKNTVVLYVDTERLLPATDPFNRQITIGLGCFLEQLRMAANSDGWQVNLTLFPEGENASHLDTRPVARAHFTKLDAPETDKLFAHVLRRRSLKVPFDMSRTVPDNLLQSVTAAVRYGSTAVASNEMQSVESLRHLTYEALALEINTPLTYQESVDLFRIGQTEVNAQPDGISFPGTKYDILRILGLFTRSGALDKTSSGFKKGAAAVLENTDTAMAHLWQITETNSRSDQINAGRDWLRINLAATAAGVGIHPISQALQEYPEMKTLYDNVHSRLAPQGGTVQMLASLGYGKAAEPSPRWPLEAKIRNTNS